MSFHSSAAAVTTGTVIEQDGKQLSTGEHSQKYPLEVSYMNKISTNIVYFQGCALD